MFTILDLAIPTRPRSEFTDRVYGYHLLKDVQQIKGEDSLPIIVMDSEAICMNYVTRYAAIGVCEFTSKPVQCRILTKAIRRALDNHTLGQPTSERHVPDRASAIRIDAPTSVNDPYIGPQLDSNTGRRFNFSSVKSFEGGELVFVTDRRGNQWVHLCGVQIISDRNGGQSIRLLRALSKMDSAGHYVRRSAEELMDIIGALSVGTITGCVQTVRRNVIERLEKQLRVECSMDDLIRHDEQGYYLRDWIVVREQVVPQDSSYSNDDNVPAGTGTRVPDVPAGTFDSVPEGTDIVPADDPAGSIALASRWNARQQWVIDELEQDIQVQRIMIQEEFDIGEKTAKRDLAELTRAGTVEYVRSARGGYYRLRS